MNALRTLLLVGAGLLPATLALAGPAWVKHKNSR